MVLHPELREDEIDEQMILDVGSIQTLYIESLQYKIVYYIAQIHLSSNQNPGFVSFYEALY